METWILKGSHTEEGFCQILLGKILIFVWSLFQNEKKIEKGVAYMRSETRWKTEREDFYHEKNKTGNFLCILYRKFVIIKPQCNNTSLLTLFKETFWIKIHRKYQSNCLIKKFNQRINGRTCLLAIFQKKIG